MSDMLERVAKSIFASRLAAGGPGITMMSWEVSPHRAWCFCTARAAIATMREPSDEMALGALKSVAPSAFVENPLNYNLLVWEHMIDTALKEDG